MLNNIVSLTKKLVSIKSPEKSLELALSHLKGYTIERFENNGVKSALIYDPKTRPKKFKIILNGHLDVIPGKDNQYIPQIKGRKLYGVGSMDMKASIACLIMVFREVAEKIDYPLGIQLVTDEEVGGFNGTKYQIEKGVRANFVVAGEPTNFDIVNKAKGILQAKISAHGQTAHGAYPWKGENAIWKMNEFLEALKKRFPIPSAEQWITTVNLSKIETSNQSFNKIPDDCVISLDVRYISEESETIVHTIKQLLPKGFKLEIICKEPVLNTDDGNQYIKTLENIGKQITKKRVILRSAHGSSDTRHFAHVNCPGIEFGPIGGGIGSDDEYVDMPSLETYYHILIKFLLTIKD